MTGPKLALAGAGLVNGGLGLAALVGALGAEMLWRYFERR